MSIHGPPLPLSGCWALLSPAFLKNLLSCPRCLLFAMQIRNASPYFFYVTCEFSLHYARYVLVHALFLVSCSGYRFFLLCHPDYLLTMAPVSMVLHVSYMPSLCKKEWHTSRQMILSAVRHGVAVKFVQFCAGLRVNKQSRVTLDCIRMPVARK